MAIAAERVAEVVGGDEQYVRARFRCFLGE
jgi:hypothetical protein